MSFAGKPGKVQKDNEKLDYSGELENEEKTKRAKGRKVREGKWERERESCKSLHQTDE